MSVKAKDFLKFTIALAFSAGIFWYVYKDFDINEALVSLKKFDYRWVVLSIVLSFGSHFLRALRWGQLLEVSGKKSSLMMNYLAVMIGYLANTVFPRLGEITRCGIVSKKEGIPMTFAVGTVFTERLIDLIILLLLTAMTFVLEFSRLSTYFSSTFEHLASLLYTYWWLLTLMILAGAWTFWYFILSKRPTKNKWVEKIRKLIMQLYSGILSITKIKRPMLFWINTIAIWVLYFLMLYVISFGSEETNNLGPLAGLAILVMGSFGMAAPTANGVGTFHAFVAGILVLYGLPEGEGKIFALILHTSQLFTVIVFGTISLILINFTKSHNINGEQKQD
uniref:lysylphosphatidylglycerol synthase transmembrane domain-containing protein n=2 Tax=Roseivirga sp. TaxID=1964215 RepID=UPI004047A73B